MMMKFLWYHNHLHTFLNEFNPIGEKLFTNFVVLANVEVQVQLKKTKKKKCSQ